VVHSVDLALPDLAPQLESPGEDRADETVFASEVFVERDDRDAGCVGDGIDAGDGDAVGVERPLGRVEDLGAQVRASLDP
jgi:hypothetical protein